MPLIGFLFPDLGSQKQGMGKTLYDKSYQARKVYQDAEKATGLKLMKFCFVTPPEEMNDPVEASVAIIAHSLAACELLKANQRDPQVLAGHGLGEVAAMAAAQVLDYPSAFQVALWRGQMMASFQDKLEGKRVWISGLKGEQRQQLISEAGKSGYIKVVSHLHPEACLLACDEAAAEKAIELARLAKAEKAEVVGEGLFGTERASAAAGEFLAKLRQVKIGNPKHIVLSGTSGQPYRSFDDFRMGLVNGLCRAVNWGAVVTRMKAEGVRSFLSLGPGSLLAIAVRKIEPGLQSAWVDDFSSLVTAIKVTRG